MQFISLGFYGFRNLVDSIVPTESKNVILVGDNGQGKTNFLEAIYTLCYGSSFRTNNIKEMCNHDKKEFSLNAIVQFDEDFKQQIFFSYTKGKREIRIDGKEVRDRRELIYNIPCIVFSHDDIEFVRGVPENRRRFFDQTMSLYDNLFFDDLRRYKVVLRQRNAAIKENVTSLIPIYDKKLAELGLIIQKKRAKEVESFNKIFGTLYKEISETDDQLTINYRPSWKGCSTVEEIEQVLSENLERDFIMQTTTSGIHRDQFVVMRNNLNFAQSGSTGQMRLASLIFRVAQIQTYRQNRQRDPILLIDDVLLELDIKKRGKFLKLLEGYNQAFFTFLPNESYFNPNEEENGLKYKVEKGNFIKQ